MVDGKTDGHGSSARETRWFVVVHAKRGWRIVAKEEGVTPKSRVVSDSTWEQLQSLNDSEFDGTVLFGLGIGAFKS